MKTQTIIRIKKLKKVIKIEWKIGLVSFGWKIQTLKKGKGRKTSIQMGTVKQLIESNTKELGKQVYQAPYNVITMITLSKW